MISNKNISKTPSGLAYRTYNQYKLQFSYCSPKKAKSKTINISSNDNYQTETSKDIKKAHSLTGNHTLKLDQQPKAFSLIINSKRKAKTRRIEQDQSQEKYVIHDFPQRKIKTNEHQLFRVLAKLQDTQMKRIKTTEIELDKQKYQSSRSHEKSTSPKRQLKLNWVKSRYCANRDKQKGFLPQTLDREHINLSKRFSSFGENAGSTDKKAWV